MEWPDIPKGSLDFDTAGSKTCLPIQKVWREMKVYQAVHLQMRANEISEPQAKASEVLK